MLLDSQKKNRPIVWSIAGSDCGGGAGIQADIKTFEDFSVHGCSAITAVTAQNTQALGSINAVDVSVLKAQLNSLMQDFPPKVIKLGMLVNAELIECVVECIAKLREEKSQLFVVCDPVLKATAASKNSESSLFKKDATKVFIEKLLPLVDLLTPNFDELKFFTQQEINNEQELDQAAQVCLNFGISAVLIKGGHVDFFSDDFVRDYFYAKNTEALVTAPASFVMQTKKIENGAHGTGCRLASAIAALIAHEYALEDAVALGHAYINAGLQTAYKAGKKQLQLAAQDEIFLENLPTILFDQKMLAVDFSPCENIGLYPVVDDVAWLEKLLPLGIKTIQLRLKNKTADELEQQIKRAVELQNEYDAQFFVNDYWQLAIKHGAYGVHLGQEDLAVADVQAINNAGLRLGVSTHGWWEIARAHSLKPSYIAIGPIYPTQTKEMPFAAQGIEQLTQWSNLLSGVYSVVAIGGINLQRAQVVMEAGASSIAVVSAITQAKDYKKATLDLMQSVAF